MPCLERIKALGCAYYDEREPELEEYLYNELSNSHEYCRHYMAYLLLLRCYRLLRDEDLFINPHSQHLKKFDCFLKWLDDYEIDPDDVMMTIETFVERQEYLEADERRKIRSWQYFDNWMLEGE